MDDFKIDDTILDIIGEMIEFPKRHAKKRITKYFQPHTHIGLEI